MKTIDKSSWIYKSRLGGIKRNLIYGNPGTLAVRSAGGKKAISFFHGNPDYARKVGFVIRKTINHPPKSVQLAEFFGIYLGDGGIRGSHQVTISYDYRKDAEYAEYIGAMIRRLFAIDYSICKRKKNNGADIVISSTHLVDFLIKNGIRHGNKVTNQLEVPAWIESRLDYSIACLRGLVDTDGGLYRHEYVSGRKIYKYLKLCFTNHSKPILEFAIKTMKRLNIQAYLSNYHVSIYSKDCLKEYFLRVRSNNPKHLLKWSSYF